ncbi:MAG: hypothetical protein ACM34E_03175, partial [Acidobacteriota bacterium]
SFTIYLSEIVIGVRDRHHFATGLIPMCLGIADWRHVATRREALELALAILNWLTERLPEPRCIFFRNLNGPVNRGWRFVNSPVCSDSGTKARMFTGRHLS